MRTLKPTLRAIDVRSVKPAPKRADPEIMTSAHKAFREAVLKRAGYRCENCGKHGGVLYADHVVERADGGATHPANGRCLCARCHTHKTNRERARRLAALG
jgi:5-methylcytosine-specific restriction endonuclease McrA